MINRDRLAETFEFLVGIDSISKEEGAISSEIVKIQELMSLSRKKQNSVDNVIGFGIVHHPVNAHMDTVEPGRGVKPVLKDGVFTSDGETILGADDKSAIAIFVETLRVIQEKGLYYGPLELVLTVCEEIGLQGAKHLDFSQLTVIHPF